MNVVRAAVIGAGAWGTALAQVLARNGHDVRLWAREPSVAAAINEGHANEAFLPGCALAETLVASNDLPSVVHDAEVMVLASPSHAVRSVARNAASATGGGAVVIVAAKGIEAGSLKTMSQVAAEELPGRPIVALSGPSFAAEVAAGQPTAIVAAASSPGGATTAQRILSSAALRVYTHDDVTGVELGGALKNVMALATGIAEGLGLGLNSRAALITRGLTEITRLGVALGARASTFAGLAGLGDLVLTCTGTLSRNRAVGIALGQGGSLAEALAGRITVAEGVGTTQSARELGRRASVELPIVDAVHGVLFGGEPAGEAMRRLMSRELRAESD